MSSTQNSIRLETLLELSLSNEWTHVEEETDKPETRANERELPSELQSLGESDKRDCLNLLGRLNKLTSEDQERWVAQRITNIRASTPERNRRMIEGIHPGQIAEALREEPARIQQLILNSLPRSLAKVVEQTLQPPARFLATDVRIVSKSLES